MFGKIWQPLKNPPGKSVVTKRSLEARYLAMVISQVLLVKLGKIWSGSLINQYFFLFSLLNLTTFKSITTRNNRTCNSLFFDCLAKHFRDIVRTLDGNRAAEDYNLPFKIFLFMLYKKVNTFEYHFHKISKTYLTFKPITRYFVIPYIIQAQSLTLSSQHPGLNFINVLCTAFMLIDP